MKVTRNRNGYAIRCNEGEFELLRGAVASVDIKSLTTIAKRAYTRRISDGSILRVDVDNRDKPSTRGQLGFGRVRRAA